MSSIRLSFGGHYESPHDYGTVFVQGGRSGLVFVRGTTDTYRTAFVECSPPGSFIRGEGATIEEADDACWAKLQAFLGCAHEYEPRSYRNGGGVCKHCRQFGSKVFTPEQLGLHCTECGAPTFHTLYGQKRLPDTERESRCKAHDPKWPYFIAQLKAMWLVEDAEEIDGILVEGEVAAMYRRLKLVADHGGAPDPEALDWAYANLDMSDAPRKEAP